MYKKGEWGILYVLVGVYISENIGRDEMREDNRLGVKIPFAGTAATIVMSVFGGMGAIFSILAGFFIAYREAEEDLGLVGIIFAIIGSAFLLVCMIILIISFSRKKKLERIVENGYYIIAEIGDIVQNYSINVNGRSPYVITARYQDSTGCIHTFRSRNIFYNPVGIMTNNMVKIYTRPDNFKLYYMNINEILPEVKMH